MIKNFPYPPPSWGRFLISGLSGPNR